MIRALQRLAKHALKRLLASCGYAVVRVGAPPRDPADTMDGALAGIAARGHRLGTVIDVGASVGSWSLSLMRHFPDCRYLLIEAQPCHRQALETFCMEHPNAQAVLAAAAETPGRVHFDASDPLGGHASATPFPKHNIEVPATTIDREVRERALPGPYLIKLDTHGYEVPILRGAAETLRDTDVVVMECYNFRIHPQALLFPEMCEYLKPVGFRCMDLVDVMHRPHDGALWQMDLVFVRDARPEFGHLEYE